MTHQEAIKNLDTMWKMLTSAHDEIADSFVVAYTMAVDALKAQTDGDTISRQVAIDAVQGIGRLATLPDNDATVRMSAVEYVLFNLPSAQPEPNYDEWCTDCKEYDKEQHCCPRWNRVIRETLNDAQAERNTGKWIIDGHHIRCDQCGMAMCDTDREGDRIPRGFCPNCGVRMDGEKR